MSGLGQGSQDGGADSQHEDEYADRQHEDEGAANTKMQMQSFPMWRALMRSRLRRLTASKEA